MFLLFKNASPHVCTVLAGNKCEATDRIVDTDSGKKVWLVKYFVYSAIL